MTEQFLNRTQIATIAKKMCSKGMSKRMRCDMRRKAKLEPQ